MLHEYPRYFMMCRMVGDRVAYHLHNVSLFCSNYVMQRRFLSFQAIVRACIKYVSLHLSCLYAEKFRRMTVEIRSFVFWRDVAA
jgi:hypothetical protein